MGTSNGRNFDADESVQGALISTWYDSNTQSIDKRNATQSTDGNKPFYNIDSSTKLPMLRFVNQDYLSLPNGTIPYGNSPYTFFLVTKATPNNCNCGILGSGNYGSSGQVNAVRYAGGGYIRQYWWGNDLNIYGGSGANDIDITDKLRIFTITYDNTSGIGRKFYIDGTYAGGKTSTSRNSGTGSNIIGKTYSSEYMSGSIAEIILYDRDLDDDERQAVEDYLGKKWKIDVASS